MSSPCVTGSPLTVAVDWDADGTYTGTGEDVSSDLTYDTPVVISWGRDEKREFFPPAAGKMTFELLNVDGDYSPENPASVVAGDVQVGRNVRAQVDHLATTYTLFEGPIDDYTLNTERTEARVSFEAVDGFETRRNGELSTPVYTTIRTGEAIAVVLDAIGWPADKRDLDYGATIIPYWWAEGVSAVDAVKALVDSEGPPAMFYVSRGVATFRDRHHRLLDVTSTDVQASYCVTGITMDCDPAASPCPTGSIGYTRPFGYNHGARNIVNAAYFVIERRTKSPGIEEVYSESEIREIALGETISVEVSTSDPFIDAVAPVEGTDFDLQAGTVSVALTRDSGQSTTILITATGSAAQIANLKLRARLLAVSRQLKVGAMDSSSINAYGTRRWEGEVPWASNYDADAIADLIVGRGAEPRPVLSVRIVACDDDHLTEILTRDISHRVRVRNDAHFFDADCHVEHITHEIHKRGRGGRHIAIISVEKAADPPPAIPFIFDEVGHGFDDGYFDGTGTSDPVNMFIFDEVGHGFDDGKFAT